MNIKVKRPELSLIYFALNVLIVAFFPWYIALAFTLLGCLLFKYYLYYTLISFSIIEIGVFSYFSVYSIIVILYVIVTILKLILRREFNFANVPKLYLVLMIIMILACLNSILFGSVNSNLPSTQNLINSLLMLFKLFMGLVLFIDISRLEKNEYENLLIQFSRHLKLFFLVIFIYFVTQANVFSMYNRFVITGMDPNDFSSRLVILLAFFTIYYFTKNSQFKKLFWFIVNTSVVLFIIVLTGSRTGLLSFVVFVGVLITIIPIKNRYRLFYIMLFIIVGYLAIFHTSYGLSILERTLSSTNTDISTGRFDVWINMIKYVFNTRPIFGYGLGKYVPQTIHFLEAGFRAFDHNIFVSVFVMSGFVGLIVYSGVLFYPIKKLIFKKINKRLLVIPVIISITAGMLLVWVFEEILLITLIISYCSLNIKGDIFNKKGDKTNGK